MANAECTTVRVVARLTPADVGVASLPSNKEIQVTTTPNTALLMTPW